MLCNGQYCSSTTRSVISPSYFQEHQILFWSNATLLSYQNIELAYHYKSCVICRIFFSFFARKEEGGRGSFFSKIWILSNLYNRWHLQYPTLSAVTGGLGKPVSKSFMGPTLIYIVLFQGMDKDPGSWASKWCPFFFWQTLYIWNSYNTFLKHFVRLCNC